MADKPNNPNKISYKKELWIPILLILISGLMGSGVAYMWEYFKFKRETIFERKMDYIISSRKEATELFVSIDGVRRVIRSIERDKKVRGIYCNTNDFAGQIEELKSYALRVNYLADFSEGIIDEESMTENVEEFKETLKLYLQCLQSETNCGCSDQYPLLMDPVKNIIWLHTMELNEQINKDEFAY